MRCESGNPCIMGCNRIENGYNFAYDCSTDTDIKLCFFDRDTLELKEEIPLKKRMGTVHSVCVCDDNIERMLYCYKADDEFINNLPKGRFLCKQKTIFPCLRA